MGNLMCIYIYTGGFPHLISNYRYHNESDVFWTSGLFLRHFHRILILKLEVLLLIPFLDPREDCRAKETTMEIAGPKLLQRHEWGVEVTTQSFRSVMLKHVETC